MSRQIPRPACERLALHLPTAHHCGRITIVALAGATALLLLSSSPARAAPRVVVLHSYHHGFTWSDNISRGIMSVLDTPDVARTEVCFEFMDTRRLSSDEYLNGLARFLAAKYEGRPVDVVICCDDHALSFVLGAGTEVFGEAPTVFCSVSGYRPEMREARPLTGLVESIDIRSTLDVALDLHPGTKEIVVITDMTRTGRALKKKAAAVFASDRPDLAVRYFEHLTFEELYNKVETLHAGTIVFLFIFSRDRDGHVLSHEENLERLAPHCAVPIYAVWDFYLGHGIVGGKLTSGEKEGRMVAGMALRILSGESARDIPLETSPTEFKFDCEQLARFDVPVSALPAGSIVLNEPYSFYRRYRGWIWFGVALFVVEVALAAQLVLGNLRLRQARRELRESGERYHLLFNSGNDILFVNEANPNDGLGRFLDANDIACRKLGYSREELLTQTADRIDLSLSTGYVALAERGPLFETEFLKSDGSHILVEVSRHRLELEGRPAFLTIARDITQRKKDESERRKLENQLRQAQKMEALGTLAGGIAHDFNNLLVGVLGHAELLQLDATPGDEVSRAAGAIMKAAQRGSELTQQLLGFARRGKLEIKDVDIHQSIQDTISIISRTIDRRIDVSLRMAANPSLVRGDPGQLDQVFLNLAVNARDAMPDGGQLVFETANIEYLSPADAAEHQLGAGAYIKATVRDTGTGMPRETRERVFEPFFTTKPKGKGTGMGLATSYGIVKSHGGAISIDSRPGEGTVVEVYLPIAQPSGEYRRLQAIVPTEGGTGTILLVDDEEAVRDVGKSMLGRLGYRVVVAADGREAVDYYRKHPGGVDAVVMDIVMPVMDGRECFAELRKLDPEVKVILVTGHSFDGSAEQLIKSGAVLMVRKPFTYAELSSALAKTLGFSDS